MNDSLAWAKDLVDRRAWVVHLETGSIGQVERLYDGAGEVYVSPVNQAPVRAPVIVMEGGASHVADPSLFVELGVAEIDFAKASLVALSDLVIDRARDSGELKRSTAMYLLSLAMKSQARLLDRAREALNRKV